MSRLIDADALYERACSLEAQAMGYVRKLTERDGDKVSVEWKMWSVALTERTAFKHDIFDAPTIEERKRGKRKKHRESYCSWSCSVCKEIVVAMPEQTGIPLYDYCPNCGADMREDDE